MQIPKEHEGCGKLRKLLFHPVEGFTTRIEDLSGKTVTTYGDSAEHFGKRPPPYIGVEGGGEVSRTIVEVAWYGARLAQQERTDRMLELMSKCPGAVSIILDPENDPLPIRVCGLIAQAIEAGEKPS